MLDEGKLASVACSLLMKVLWAARLARPDLLRAVNHLARKVSKWTSTRDSMMSRLMGYTQATLHLEESGGLVIRETIFPSFLCRCQVCGRRRYAAVYKWLLLRDTRAQLIVSPFCGEQKTDLRISFDPRSRASGSGLRFTH